MVTLYLYTSTYMEYGDELELISNNIATCSLQCYFCSAAVFNAVYLKLTQASISWMCRRLLIVSIVQGYRL